jgi:RNA polymerase sigma factor (sigma-70 family)
VRTQALRKHYRPRLEPLHEDPPAPTLDGLAALIARDDEHEQEQRLLDLHARIAQLPPIYRQALELFYFERKRIKTIAQDVGISVGAVKLRLWRGRRKLR